MLTDQRLESFVEASCSCPWHNPALVRLLKCVFYPALVIRVCFWCTVENENHCDFVRLREMLVRTNMEDLRETTHYQHYERYRRCKLQEMGFSDDEAMRCVDNNC